MIGVDFLENGEVIVIGGGSSGSQSRELVGICCRKFYLLAVALQNVGVLLARFIAET